MRKRGKTAVSKDEIKSGKKGREVGRKQRFTENQGGKKKLI